MGKEQEDKTGTAREKAVQKESEDYNIALEAIRNHHATQNTYSGKFLRPHVKYLKQIIEDYDIESILDYGCGKGLQYEWVFPPTPVMQDGSEIIMPEGMSIEQYWGQEVTKYDPGVPKFEAKPTGKYDLVLCTHVLGCIPLQDLRSWVLDEIFGYANKFVYIVEAIGKPKKNVIDYSKIECPINYSPIKWLDLIAPHKPTDVTCELVCRYRSDVGTFTGRFRI
ncbi:MAG TPA: hypothetical protein VIY48_16385 [Candidatus Paceibacterota bacterium]